MPDAAHCPQCDTLLPADAVEGLCPKCLLRLAIATEPDASDTLPVAAGAEAAEEQQFGAYRIVRVLGEGGMGTVYLAEQRQPIRRVVALKVIKLGMSTREVMARFDSERQTLALMDHPHIARVFDAGASERGRPYFVMEYVDGVPITEYCDRHRLNNRERIELFIAVCQAVHHAHQKGIIHRDIKPSNVLVVEQDGKPFPKVIDFGIAKAIDQRAMEQATFTQVGSLVGTPEYMSPEQTLLSANIDTTTDVYSLGVLLYELLAGALPFEGKRLREAGLAELLRIIREEDPPTPSEKVSKLEDTAEVAERRSTNPAALRRQLDGDLNWIVMKALEKERLRRYASVSELAADIRRHLENQPVLASPPSKLYRARKFVRRHRVGVATVAAACIFLAASAAIVIRESHVARIERDSAQRRFNDVRHLAHSVIFDLDDKIRALPGSTPVRKELIANVIGYVDRLAEEAAGDQGLQQELAEAYLRIGNVQGGGNENLGDKQGALASFQKAERVARALAAAQPSLAPRKLLIQALHGSGHVYHTANDPAKEEAYGKEALAIARDLQKQYSGNQDAEFLIAGSLFDMATLANDSQSLGYRLEALPLFEELLRANPPDPERQRNAALIHKSIAGYWLTRDSDRALPYLQRAMSLDEARLASDSRNPGAKLDLSFDYSQFGEYYEGKEDLPTAIAYQRKTLAIRRDLAASDPKDVWKQERLAWTLTSTAILLVKTQDNRGALANLDESKRIIDRLGITDVARMDVYALTLDYTGLANRNVGNEQPACELFSRARDLYRKLGSRSSSADTRMADLEQALATCAR